MICTGPTLHDCIEYHYSLVANDLAYWDMPIEAVDLAPCNVACHWTTKVTSLHTLPRLQAITNAKLWCDAEATDLQTQGMMQQWASTLVICCGKDIGEQVLLRLMQAGQEQAAAMWEQHRAAHKQQLAEMKEQLQTALQEGRSTQEALQVLELETRQQVHNFLGSLSRWG